MINYRFLIVISIVLRTGVSTVINRNRNFFFFLTIKVPGPCSGTLCRVGGRAHCDSARSARQNIVSYFDRGQFFGGVGGVPECLQRDGRPAVVVLADQKVRRLGYAQRSDQMEQHPHGARQTKRHVRDERAERVREQYAGDDEELKYRSQTTCETGVRVHNMSMYVHARDRVITEPMKRYSRRDFRLSLRLVFGNDESPADDENSTE